MMIADCGACNIEMIELYYSSACESSASSITAFLYGINFFFWMSLTAQLKIQQPLGGPPGSGGRYPAIG